MITIGIYSAFVPVHVKVSDLVLVPESEIIVTKPAGQTPVTIYHIGSDQIKKVEEYIVDKYRLSPWREDLIKNATKVDDNETKNILPKQPLTQKSGKNNCKRKISVSVDRETYMMVATSIV